MALSARAGPRARPLLPEPYGATRRPVGVEGGAGPGEHHDDGGAEREPPHFLALLQQYRFVAVLRGAIANHRTATKLMKQWERETERLMDANTDRNQ